MPGSDGSCCGEAIDQAKQAMDVGGHRLDARKPAHALDCEEEIALRERAAQALAF
jgi:hypothetical protein